MGIIAFVNILVFTDFFLLKIVHQRLSGCCSVIKKLSLFFVFIFLSLAINSGRYVPVLPVFEDYRNINPRGGREDLVAEPSRRHFCYGSLAVELGSFNLPFDYVDINLPDWNVGERTAENAGFTHSHHNYPRANYIDTFKAIGGIYWALGSTYDVNHQKNAARNNPVGKFYIGTMLGRLCYARSIGIVQDKNLINFEVRSFGILISGSFSPSYRSYIASGVYRVLPDLVGNPPPVDGNWVGRSRNRLSFASSSVSINEFDSAAVQGLKNIESSFLYMSSFYKDQYVLCANLSAGAGGRGRDSDFSVYSPAGSSFTNTATLNSDFEQFPFKNYVSHLIENRNDVWNKPLPDKFQDDYHVFEYRLMYWNHTSGGGWTDHPLKLEKTFMLGDQNLLDKVMIPCASSGESFFVITPEANVVRIVDGAVDVGSDMTYSGGRLLEPRAACLDLATFAAQDKVPMIAAICVGAKELSNPDVGTPMSDSVYNPWDPKNYFGYLRVITNDSAKFGRGYFINASRGREGQNASDIDLGVLCTDMSFKDNVYIKMVEFDKNGNLFILSSDGKVYFYSYEQLKTAVNGTPTQQSNNGFAEDVKPGRLIKPKVLSAESGALNIDYISAGDGIVVRDNFSAELWYLSDEDLQAAVSETGSVTWSRCKNNLKAKNFVLTKDGGLFASDGVKVVLFNKVDFQSSVKAMLGDSLSSANKLAVLCHLVLGADETVDGKAVNIPFLGISTKKSGTEAVYFEGKGVSQGTVKISSLPFVKDLDGANRWLAQARRFYSELQEAGEQFWTPIYAACLRRAMDTLRERFQLWTMTGGEVDFLQDSKKEAFHDALISFESEIVGSPGFEVINFQDKLMEVERLRVSGLRDDLREKIDSLVAPGSSVLVGTTGFRSFQEVLSGEAASEGGESVSMASLLLAWIEAKKKYLKYLGFEAKFVTWQDALRNADLKVSQRTTVSFSPRLIMSSVSDYLSALQTLSSVSVGRLDTVQKGQIASIHYQLERSYKYYMSSEQLKSARVALKNLNNKHKLDSDVEFMAKVKVNFPSAESFAELLLDAFAVSYSMKYLVAQFLSQSVGLEGSKDSSAVIKSMLVSLREIVTKRALFEVTTASDAEELFDQRNIGLKESFQRLLRDLIRENTLIINYEKTVTPSVVGSEVQKVSSFTSLLNLLVRIDSIFIDDYISVIDGIADRADAADSRDVVNALLQEVDGSDDLKGQMLQNDIRKINVAVQKMEKAGASGLVLNYQASNPSKALAVLCDMVLQKGGRYFEDVAGANVNLQGVVSPISSLDLASYWLNQFKRFYSGMKRENYQFWNKSYSKTVGTTLAALKDKFRPLDDSADPDWSAFSVELNEFEKTLRTENSWFKATSLQDTMKLLDQLRESVQASDLRTKIKELVQDNAFLLDKTVFDLDLYGPSGLFNNERNLDDGAAQEDQKTSKASILREWLGIHTQSGDLVNDVGLSDSEIAEWDAILVAAEGRVLKDTGLLSPEDVIAKMVSDLEEVESLKTKSVFSQADEMRVVDLFFELVNNHKDYMSVQQLEQAERSFKHLNNKFLAKNPFSGLLRNQRYAGRLRLLTDRFRELEGETDFGELLDKVFVSSFGPEYVIAQLKASVVELQSGGSRVRVADVLTRFKATVSSRAMFELPLKPQGSAVVGSSGGGDRDYLESKRKLYSYIEKVLKENEEIKNNQKNVKDDDSENSFKYWNQLLATQATPKDYVFLFRNLSMRPDAATSDGVIEIVQEIFKKLSSPSYFNLLTGDDFEMFNGAVENFDKARMAEGPDAKRIEIGELNPDGVDLPLGLASLCYSAVGPSRDYKVGTNTPVDLLDYFGDSSGVEIQSSGHRFIDDVSEAQGWLDQLIVFVNWLDKKFWKQVYADKLSQVFDTLRTKYSPWKRAGTSLSLDKDKQSFTQRLTLFEQELQEKNSYFEVSTFQQKMKWLDQVRLAGWGIQVKELLNKHTKAGSVVLHGKTAFVDLDDVLKSSVNKDSLISLEKNKAISSILREWINENSRFFETLDISERVVEAWEEKLTDSANKIGLMIGDSIETILAYIDNNLADLENLQKKDSFVSGDRDRVVDIFKELKDKYKNYMNADQLKKATDSFTRIINSYKLDDDAAITRDLGDKFSKSLEAKLQPTFTAEYLVAQFKIAVFKLDFVDDSEQEVPVGGVVDSSKVNEISAILAQLQLMTKFRALFQSSDLTLKVKRDFLIYVRELLNTNEDLIDYESSLKEGEDNKRFSFWLAILSSEPVAQDYIEVLVEISQGSGIVKNANLAKELFRKIDQSLKSSLSKKDIIRINAAIDNFIKAGVVDLDKIPSSEAVDFNQFLEDRLNELSDMLDQDTGLIDLAKKQELLDSYELLSRYQEFGPDLDSNFHRYRFLSFVNLVGKSVDSMVENALSSDSYLSRLAQARIGIDKLVANFK